MRAHGFQNSGISRQGLDLDRPRAAVWAVNEVEDDIGIDGKQVPPGEPSVGRFEGAHDMGACDLDKFREKLPSVAAFRSRGVPGVRLTIRTTQRPREDGKSCAVTSIEPSRVARDEFAASGHASGASDGGH